MYQVIIVGAGPAGAYLAYLLATAGIKTLVLEKERFPRYKPCGGGVTPKAINFLPFDLGAVIEDVVHTITFTHRLDNPVTITVNKPIAYMVSRERFDAFLADKAKEAGAQILEGVRVNRVEVTGGYVSVNANAVEWQGKILVGADGAFSVVARSLGFGGRKMLAATLESEIPVPAATIKQSQGTIKIEYGLVPNGYAWIFPKAGHLSAGVWSNSAKQIKLRGLLEKFLQVENLSKFSSGVRPLGWAIPVKPQPGELHRGRALLLGDAAGLADALTGEGIYAALFSAHLAAKVIAEQVDQPVPDLQKYANLVREEMGADMAGANRLTHWIPPITGLIHSVLRRHQELVHEFMEVAGGNISYTNFLQTFRKQLRAALHL